MGFLQRARAFVAGAWPGAAALPWLGERIYAGGASLPGVLAPAAARALTQTYRACAILSDAFSTQPPQILARAATGGRVRVSDTAAARALATLSQTQAEAFAWGVAFSGNGYLRIERDGNGAAFALRAIPAWRVSVEVEDGTERLFYRIAPDATVGQTTELLLAERDVVHAAFRVSGTNAIVGVAPLATCAPAFALAIQSREVLRALYSNLAHPGGVIVTPNKMDPLVAKRLQTEWQQQFGGNSRGHVAILTNGLDYKPVRFSAVDAQLLESIKASTADVARAYGIPKQFLEDEQHMTYASASEGTRSLYALALRSWCARLADALSQKLLTRSERAAGSTVEIDLSGMLVIPGSKEQSDFLGGLVSAAVLTSNDARNALGYPDVEGGDTLRLVPSAAPGTKSVQRDPSERDWPANQALHRQLLEYHACLSEWYEELVNTGRSIADLCHQRPELVAACREVEAIDAARLENLRPPSLWGIFASREWYEMHGCGLPLVEKDSDPADAANPRSKLWLPEETR